LDGNQKPFDKTLRTQVHAIMTKLSDSNLDFKIMIVFECQITWQR